MGKESQRKGGFSQTVRLLKDNKISVIDVNNLPEIQLPQKYLSALSDVRMEERKGNDIGTKSLFL